jgi:tetratricopeptide (TPR) repeat protein
MLSVIFDRLNFTTNLSGCKTSMQLRYKTLNAKNMKTANYAIDLIRRSNDMREMTLKDREEAVAQSKDLDRVASLAAPFELIKFFRARLHEVDQSEFGPVTRARIHAAKDELDEAQALLEQSSHPLAGGLLGNIYAEKGDLETAQQLYEAHPHDISAQLTLADIYSRSGDPRYQSAMHRVMDVQQVTSGHMRIYYAGLGFEIQAWDAVRRGDILVANRASQLAANNLNFRACIPMGDAMVMVRDFHRAQIAYSTAAKAGHVLGFARHVELLVRMGHEPEAREVADHASQWGLQLSEGDWRQIKALAQTQMTTNLPQS